MRPSRSVLQTVLVVGLGMSLGLFAAAPAWTQTAASATRSIPAFPRPAGFPDPARRVIYAYADEAPPMMVRTGPNTLEPLYRRSGDGFTPVRAAGYRIAMTSCPSITTGGDFRTRMIDLAAAEWAYFGLPVLDMAVEPAAIVPRVPQPSGVVEIISPQRNASIGDRVLRQAPRLGLMEDDLAVEAAIAGYWAATGNEEAMRVQSIVNYGWHEAGWAMPWSAAFISWLACEAGLTTDQFRRSGGHIDYVRAAVRARDGQDPGHLFVAYDLKEATPEAGDLLCTARGESSFASIADIRSGNSPSTALHCDLVVKTDAKRNRLYAIGGNVNHSVTLSVIATDTKGRPLTDQDIIGAHRWFAVLKPRAGGKLAHDLDGTPTVQMLYRDYARYAAGRRAPPPVPVRARDVRAKTDAASP
ncbi:DUF2272 domain-containing protein [Lysobacter sp. MMG2]|uniref:DUF2272 domain-containing protein n=1 Tax=Lysobacter sp. MMG2 TaxID=2801338 RepID=UPI001C22D9DA|nr:DUF2272 domain-containing protein [Lysobacter sp. MMG2]MBU8976523.1 DUF2272 domain-containing protein [Lysobacter sp. MMG2]